VDEDERMGGAGWTAGRDGTTVLIRIIGTNINEMINCKIALFRTRRHACRRICCW
jgi:uncharacterized membrane protein